MAHAGGHASVPFIGLRRGPCLTSADGVFPTRCAAARAAAARRVIRSMIGGRCLAAIGWFLLVPIQSAPCATRTDERLHVLFLGDRGHHEPAKRADEAYAPLARLGIDLT